MIEQGIRDFAVAKRKAADRLGARARNVLPSNAQIEARLAERQRIFEPDGHPGRLESLRRVAADLMGDLSEFETRLVGAVLAGTATINAVIELHVFCDAAEEVAFALQSRAIDFRSSQKRYRMSRKDNVDAPAYRFKASGQEVLLVVFPVDGIRQAPLSPVDQKPMRRARREQVLALGAL